MRQHLAGRDGDGLAIMSGFSSRACKDDFTAGKHAREKRFRASIALSRPAMRRTDRFFEIIDPARWAIASAQAPGDLETRAEDLRRWERGRSSSLASPAHVNSRSALITAGRQPPACMGEPAGPPPIAVSPSPESETEEPCSGGVEAPVPTSFACWVHVPPERGEHPHNLRPTTAGGSSRPS